MKRRFNVGGVSILGLLPAILVAHPALAQESTVAQEAAPVAEEKAATGGIEDIIVTAQRRDQSVRDVAIAITSVSGEQLETRGVVSSVDIAKMTPGVSISGSIGGQSLQFAIRGVVQADYGDISEPPIAVYIDDTYISNQQGQVLGTFDLDRVEVLKGPQGTLFGRNATGGLVHFIPRRPVFRDEASLIASVGNFNSTRIEAAVNHPLSDTVAIRIAGVYDRHGNWWKNIGSSTMAPGAPLTFTSDPARPVPTIQNGFQDLGAETKFGLRAQILFEPNDNLKIRVAGSWGGQNLGTGPFFATPTAPVVDAQGRVINNIEISPTETRSIVGPDGQNYFNPAIFGFQGFQFSPNNDGRRAPGATWFGYVPPNPKSRQLGDYLAQSDNNRTRTWSAALHIDWDLGNDISLTSISAYRDYFKNFTMNSGASPVALLNYQQLNQAYNVTQELRLAGSSPDFNWVVGGFYQHNNSFENTPTGAPAGSLFALFLGADQTGISPSAVSHLKSNSISAFGQVEYKFADRWTIVAGIRGIIEKQDFEYNMEAIANTSPYVIVNEPVLYQLATPFADKRTQRLWAGKLQLEFRPVDGLLTYIGLHRGVKAGAYNSQLAGNPPLDAASVPYQPEKLTSLEGGVKWTSDDRTVQVDASAYHYWYDDFQAFRWATYSGIIENVKARTYGGELSITTAPVEGLRVGAAVAYVHAEIPNLSVASGVVRSVTPAYVPKYTGSAQIAYTFGQEVLGGHIGFTYDVSYKSSFYNNFRNFDGERWKGNTLHDASLNWTSANEKVIVGAYVKNLTDKRYRTVGFDLSEVTGGTLTAYGDPRTFGARVSVKY